MYNVIIKTNLVKPKEIHLKVENLDDPEFKEIIEQPYVVEVRAEQSQLEQLKKERDEALMHVVGTSYWNQVAHEKNEEIKKLTK